ncbi:MAG: glycosyltransferase [Gammaproteobacteria bacterium]|nr:glycosyltransferase [Gammaproteobacteria bacterium]
MKPTTEMPPSSGLPDPTGADSLRIAILSDAGSERNGVGAYYYDLVAQLQGQVAVIELIGPGVADGVWDGRLSMGLPGDSTQRLILPPLRKINRALQRLNPQVIVVPTPGPYGLLGWWYARRHRARLIMGLHTHFESLAELYWNRVLGGVNRAYFNFSNGLLLKEAALVLANSEHMVETAREMGARDIELIGTPLPTEFVEKPLPPSDGSIIRVLFAGRLAAEKNVEHVLEAAERLPHLEFSIAGDGPLRARVEEKARALRNLRVLGWLNRGDMLEVMDACDVLVLPSSVETFGTIALEAMVRGRVALVSLGCGIVEWDSLNPGLCTIEPGESVTTALQRLFALSAAERLGIGRTARAAAVELNQWNLQRWLEVLLAVRGEDD